MCVTIYICEKARQDWNIGCKVLLEVILNHVSDCTDQTQSLNLKWLVVLVDAALEDCDECLKSLSRVVLHDLLAVYIDGILVFLIEVLQSLAEREHSTSRLGLHLESRLRDHQTSKDWHELRMVFDLNIGAKVVHKLRQSAKSCVSDP